MGRPGKSAPRKMKPPVHVLFPVGKNGGVRRSVDAAAKTCVSDNSQLFGGGPAAKQVEGLVHLETGERKCPQCGTVTFKSKCPDCGTHTNAVYRCPVCGKIGDPGMTVCPVCNMDLVCQKESIFSMKAEYESAIARAGITHPRDIPEVKGVQGLISKERVVEPLEKGILRAKHDIYVFRDGTIRYDMIDLPLTHFKPKEIAVSVEKLRSIGYTKDTYGNELTSPEQVVELLPQDIMVSEDCGEYLVRVSQYVDELLVNLYELEPFYNAEKPEPINHHDV